MKTKTWRLLIKINGQREREEVTVEAPDVIGAMQVGIYRWMNEDPDENRLGNIQAIEVEDMEL